MASGMYTSAKKLWADGDIHWLTDTIKATLIDQADYSVVLAVNDFFNDIPSAARVATGTLASKTSTDGILDAADLTLTSVTGDPSEIIVIWKDTGVESTSPLLFYLDGMSVTPTGTNITVVWNASGIVNLFG